MSHHHHFDQPAPIPNAGRKVWDLVIEDMKERDIIGTRRYGTPLQTFNGRNALVDAYQEALDLVVYVRQAIEEGWVFYLAGLIDGEAWLGASSDYQSPKIVICMTVKEPLQWAQKVTGAGNLRWRDSKKAGHRGIWKWEVNKKADVFRIASAVLPYLKVKRAQAHLLKMLSLYRDRSARVKMTNILSILNKRGVEEEKALGRDTEPGRPAGVGE